MTDELIDIFDEEMHFLRAALKSEAHNHGWWHKVFFCWLIRRTENGHLKIWVQLRNKNKLIGGGLLDASCAGHFLAGENLEQALCREAKEELGLSLSFDNIIQFGITKRLSHGDNIKNAEIVHRCYALTSTPLSSLVLQKDELDGIFEMDLADAIKLFSEQTPTIKISGIGVDENNTCIPVTKQVSIADFMDYGKKTYRDFFINLQNKLKENKMADELIDIYDSNMNHLGTTPRSQAHKEGLWHKAFHCWIVKRASDGRHRVLLQLRSKNKDSHPSLLDISAAGHLQAGESPKDGIREIEEELGLKVDFEKLNKLFTVKHVGEHRNYINREFNPTYLLESEKNLSELRMNPQEVDGILEATVDDLRNLFAHKVNTIYVSGLLLDEYENYVPHTGSVSISDFVPHEDSYYVKVMDAIKRYFDNQPSSAA